MLSRGALMTGEFPGLLRTLRRTHHLTQEMLAEGANLSTRHLSFLENGKAGPSREMVTRLARALKLELRDQNTLLESAGFHPRYDACSLDSLSLAPVRRAIDMLFAKYEPYGAVLLDRRWNVVDMNAGAQRLLMHFAPPSLDPEILQNIVRAILHPKGLKAAIVDWLPLASVALERLERDCAGVADDDPRRALLDEVNGYPDIDQARALHVDGAGSPVAVVHLRQGDHEVKLFNMITTLGTPQDVTAQELAIEAYFPADDDSDRFLRQLSAMSA